MPRPENSKGTSFADRVKSLRQKNSLTASDLAKLAKVSPAAVWNWEKNGTTPRPGTMKALARSLGVSTEFLLTGEHLEGAMELPATGTSNAVRFSPDNTSLETASLEDLLKAIELKGFKVSVNLRS
jgi:transcriptional regulator with XRE-family HTH domain